MKKKTEREVIFYEIGDFKFYLQGTLNLSDNTINAYLSDLYQYEKFLHEYENIEDVTEIERDDIQKYIQSLKRKKLSKASISRKVIAIKEFHKFLKKENITRDNPAKLIETPKTDKALPS